MSRSIYVDSAMHVVKGAVVSSLRIATGRTTLSVGNNWKGANTPHSGSITVGGVKTFAPEKQKEIQDLVDKKIAANDKFHIYKVPRETAEKVYLEAMYDKFPVPANVKELRICRLQDWNVNCQANPVVKSTRYLGRIEITAFKHNGNKETLEIAITCHPEEGGAPPIAAEQIALPPLAECVPDSSVDNDPLNKADDAEGKTQTITPYDVVADEGIDYDKLCRDFGCSKIDDKLIARFEKITGKKAHRFLRRGLFFTHRDLNELLDEVEKGVPFYLYTGRGPSSESLHIGHLVPFFFTKWLQDAFNVPLVIQITDDEKAYFKESITPEEAHRMAYANIKDIIACGFNPETTFIFTDFDYMGTMYPLVASIAKKIPFNQARGALGIDESANLGKCFHTAVQAAPSFPECFPHIFGGRKDVRCLIPQAIDQDPFFRITRDIAPRLGLMKPALIHSKFFPALQGHKTKMSSSASTPSTIFVTDTPKDIESKIKKYALSGGGIDKEEHMKNGANLEVDVSYEYLRYVLEDDAEFARIGKEYGAGRMFTGEVKAILIAELKAIVGEHQEARKKITDEIMRGFMDTTRTSLRYF